MRSFRFRGMTLIDVLVGIGIFLVVFMGLFGILRASLQVSGLAKLKAVATTVATTQMEYLRSLPYDDIGTLGGIPSGLVPQYASSTNGGLIFDVRTYIEYADDPADGTGSGDTNGITTDYKHLKVVVSYTANGTPRSIALVSNAVPKGIESTAGGGTLLVSVVDSIGAPVPGASVRIQNMATVPTIDFSTFSDSTGLVNLPGAPTSTEYRVSISKTGYSSAQNYARDATNTNPNPGYLTVVEGSTTTGTFSIDRLATLILNFFSPIEPFSWSDALDDADEVYALSNVQVTSGEIILSGAPGSYAPSGSARSTTTAPLRLATWTEADVSASSPPSTAVRVFIADSSATPLPDAVVPGNSAGFTSGPIDLSGVSTTTYPALRLVAELSSNDAFSTSRIQSWSIAYEAGPNPLPAVPFELTGAKTVGTTVGGISLYKTTIASTTDAAGLRSILLEWDSYELSIPGYTTVSAEPLPPYDVLPATTVDASLILTSP